MSSATTPWKVTSPLRDVPPEALRDLRSKEFRMSLSAAFATEINRRCGEPVIQALGTSATGVFGKFVLSGLLEMEPYGDVHDRTRPPDGAGQLDERSRELILVGILAAESSTVNLAYHMAVALVAGASVSELEATLALVGRWTGAENAMDAIVVLRHTERAVVEALHVFGSDPARAGTVLLDRLLALQPGARPRSSGAIPRRRHVLRKER